MNTIEEISFRTSMYKGKKCGVTESVPSLQTSFFETKRARRLADLSAL
jgi:hypothetical protein